MAVLSVCDGVANTSLKTQNDIRVIDRSEFLTFPILRNEFGSKVFDDSVQGNHL